MTWTLGIASGACMHRHIVDVLPAIRAAGVTGVEIGTPPAHFDPRQAVDRDRLAAALRQTGLTPVSIHAPFGPTTDLASAERQEREAGIAAVVAAIDALAHVGGRVVVVHPSDLERHGRDVEAHLGACARSLAVLHDYCQDLGLVLAVESPLPHLIGGHPEEFRWLLQQLPTSTRVCLDTGHTTLGAHWHRFLEVCGRRLVHVHASDNHGHRDDHLPPGDGRIDWNDIRHGLQSVGFSGWIMLELSCGDGDLAAYFRRAVAQASAWFGEALAPAPNPG